MLAPMSGVSDLAMRRIARRFGAALVFSEMVAAETYLDGDTEAAMRAEGEGFFPTRYSWLAASRRRSPRLRAGSKGRGLRSSTSIWVVRRGAYRARWPEPR